MQAYILICILVCLTVIKDLINKLDTYGSHYTILISHYKFALSSRELHRVGVKRLFIRVILKFQQVLVNMSCKDISSKVG